IALALAMSSLVAGPVLAQTTTTTGTGTVTGGTTTGTTTGGTGTPSTGAPAPGGAFASLSPGNQKIAQALFDAQKAPTTTTATTSTSGTTKSSTPTTSTTISGPKPLTLDQIAKMKDGGRGWGNVFR